MSTKNNKKAVAAIVCACFLPFIFGISVGFTGPAFDTMKNTVKLNYEVTSLAPNSTVNGTTTFTGKVSRPVSVNLKTNPDNLFVFDTTEAALFSSLLTIGAMVGALLGGPINDFLGRRWSMILLCPFYCLFWVIMGIGINSYLLIAFRVFNGLLVGIGSSIVPVYIGETSPKELRGMLGACNQLSITIGILVVYLLGILLNSSCDGFYPEHTFEAKSGETTFTYYLPQIDSLNGKSPFCNWRILSFIMLAPSALLGLLGFFFCVETPRFLAKKGKINEAKECLKKIRGDPDQDELDALGCEGVTDDSKKFEFSKFGLYKKQMGIALFLQVLQQLSGINAVMFYQTTIFQAAGITNPGLYAMLVMLLQVVITVVACALMDKAGRKVLLTGAAAGMVVCAICIGLFFFLKDVLKTDVTNLGWLAIAACMLYVVSFSMGVGAIPWLILGEIFDDSIRGPAAAICGTCNWLFAFLVTLVLGIDGIVKYLSWIFWFFALCCVVLIIFTQLAVPETKGKSIEEITAIFNGKKHNPKAAADDVEAPTATA